MTAPLDLEALVRRVRALDLPAGDYALHGSSVLLAHGLVATVNDVDLVARGAAWERAARLAPVLRAQVDPVVRPSPEIEIFHGWLDDDPDELIDTAETLHGLPFVTLAAVLAFKRRLGRPKDRAHIALIERHLARSRPDH